MSSSQEVCPVCHAPNAQTSLEPDSDVRTVDCPSCGQFRITARARSALDDLTDGRSLVHLLRGVLRHARDAGQTLELTTDTVPALIAAAQPPADPWAAFDTILLWIHARTTSIVEAVPINLREDAPLIYARNDFEFRYYLSKMKDLGLIEMPDGGSARLSLDGWKRVGELRSKRPVSNQAFVAMWFHEQLHELWTHGLQPALEATGYRPVRIDLVQHNDRIDDRIIAEIRKSSLLIADFTGHRGGVYFEAGFGLGLGIPVIWLCRQDSIDGLHFDTRQYNHILWTDPDDARTKLIARIEASVLNRPL